MNNTEIRELDNVLETARLRSVHRLREALQKGADPDPLDVLVVADYRNNRRSGPRHGPWDVVKRQGPAAGAGMGFMGVVIALIETVGKALASG